MSDDPPACATPEEQEALYAREQNAQCERRDSGAHVRGKCAKIIGPMREVARKLGYAIAIHGSLKRDIDLIACPWTEEAAVAQDFVAAVVRAIREANDGIGFILEQHDVVAVLEGHPKPHGRRCWSIQLGGTYVDLSVMPRIKDHALANPRA